jgi:peptide/nickel transport system substrate-binding protein
MKKSIFSIGAALCLGLTLPLIFVAAASGSSPLESNQVIHAAKAASSLSATTFVEISMGDPDNLDPALDYETAGSHVIQQIYEPLLFFKRDSVTEFVPMLATGWDVSPDGKVYVFDIRKGVKFHNGDDLTPEDVAYTFQRGILQGGSNSPQWLFTEPILGAGKYDITNLEGLGAYGDDRAGLKTADPSKLLAACQMVTTAITADNANGTVTFKLAQAWGPFLFTLAQPFGSIMDKAWTIQKGGWDGNCATWQNYYAATTSDDPLASITNGTGPFMLDHWTPGSEIGLARNPHYWQTTPMWDNGPSGIAALQQVLIKNISDETTRFNMLVNGEADSANGLSPDHMQQLDDLTVLHYNTPDGQIGIPEHLTGTIKAYSGGLSPTSSDAFFTYNISTGGPRNYVGSGALDGNGIPANFFSDVHVRKAFNYSFDWDAYINSVYAGNAVQRHGPIPYGLLGYTDTQATYFNSPTLALQEFTQAWSGDVIKHGFVMTITYNEGNSARAIAATILKNNIEAITTTFHINAVELPASSFGLDSSSRRLPVFFSGWMEDIPHPHNWVQPYLFGFYASRQNIPESQRNIYGDKINECVGLIGDAAQGCYEQLQNTAYNDAIDIFLTQSYTRQYIRAEVRGYYVNSHTASVYFYALSKGALPTFKDASPAQSEILTFTNSGGSQASLALPTGVITQPLELMYTPDARLDGAPSGYRLGNMGFDIQAFNNGNQVNPVTFQQPVSMTIQYTGQAAGFLIPDEMRLFTWNGNAWVDAACGPYSRDPLHNRLTVPICHLSKFALGGLSHDIFLPMVKR